MLKRQRTNVDDEKKQPSMPTGGKGKVGFANNLQDV